MPRFVQTLYETALWQMRADQVEFRASAVLLLQQRYAAATRTIIMIARHACCAACMLTHSCTVHSLQVANIVADEYRGLAEVFSAEHMALFLARMRASSVQLVHLEGRLNLPSKAATGWDPLD